jgi:hypothetical protein
MRGVQLKGRGDCMPAASRGGQRGVGGGKEMTGADEAQSHIASVVSTKECLAQLGAQVPGGRKARGAQRGAAECARRWGQGEKHGGDEHRGQERVGNSRSSFADRIWALLRTKGKHRREQATAIGTMYIQAIPPTRSYYNP